MEKKHKEDDMNNMVTKFSKKSGVHHIKNMRKKIKNIKVPKVIIDHPIIIYQMNMTITLCEEFEEIDTFD